jgi:hypothetical protein
MRVMAQDVIRPTLEVHIKPTGFRIRLKDFR